MKKQVYHEGYNYVLEYNNNSLIMYKEDIDEWMGDKVRRHTTRKVIVAITNESMGDSFGQHSGQYSRATQQVPRLN